MKLTKDAMKLLFGDVSKLREIIDIPRDVLMNASCTPELSETFYSDEASEQAKALAICSGCKAIDSCLAYALPSEEYGIWGGTTPEQRAKMRMKSAIVSPDQRHLVLEIRSDLDRKIGAKPFASKYQVTQRTYYRWLDKLEDAA